VDRGREENIPAFVAELLGENVDVLVTTHTGAVRAAKRVTSTVPIVMAGVSNPEKTGLVESLARPGGNSRASEACGPNWPRRGWSSSRSLWVP
jgi:ABC-type uncharacterized transport system substrate-binding protein